MTTYYARKEYIYSGGDAVFSIPFSYIKKEHINVLIKGEKTENYTFVNATQIRITETMETGTTVTIARTTPIDERMVIFSNTSILDKDVQNLAQNQVFSAVQELYDNNDVFEDETNETIADNKVELEGIIETNRQEVLGVQADFEQEVNTTIAQNKAATEKEIADFEQEVNTTIAQNKAATEKEIADFEQEVNTTIETVKEAAEKVNELEEAEEVISAITPKVDKEIEDRVSDVSYLQNQINYLQIKAQGVCSEYLNFLRAGSTHTSLKIGADTELKFKLGSEECLYKNTADDEFDVISKLDTGTALTAGKDYCVYMVKLASTTTGYDFVVSLNSTYPTGYTANNTYKIGGFHTLCLAVTSSNAPALKTGSFWSTHPAIGYATADIIPNSVWCLTHRPISDPNGMVYVDRANKWFDIYLQSGTFTGTASVYKGTTTDTRQPILHQYDLLCVYKQMMTDNDFMIASEGSNQATNISGSADPVTTGGHVDTASKRMISGYFLEDCCGALWQWLMDMLGWTGSSWQGYGTNAADRGQTYGMPYVLRAGGLWSSGSYCGSWGRSCDSTRSSVLAADGCRGVSLPLFIGKVA